MNEYEKAVAMQSGLANIICRTGLPCFAQVGLSSGGYRCTILSETPAKGKPCAFRKVLQADRTRKEEKKETVDRSHVVYRTSSGVVFG